jgi:hypothetical protein
LASELLAEKLGKQMPHRLNFTPTSANAALFGDPDPPVRDDKNKGL